MGFVGTKRAAGGVVLLVGLTVAAGARADAVGPPPKECPPGAWGQTTHYGPHCAPYSCTSDSECKAGQKCRPHALCVWEHTYEHWRGNTHVLKVTGDCAEPGTTCPEESECCKGSYCMPDKPPPPPASAKPATSGPAPSGSPSEGTPPKTTPPAKGCGACTLGATAPSRSPLLPALVSLLALMLRRSRRQAA